MLSQIEIMDGITEVLAYGTAVWAEPVRELWVGDSTRTTCGVVRVFTGRSPRCWKA